MPAQSGSSVALERMRRGYTRQAYDDLVAHVRAVIPEVALRWGGLLLLGRCCVAAGLLAF
jgi:tRNA A37 methylthiotransferase MiaB